MSPVAHLALLAVVLAIPGFLTFVIDRKKWNHGRCPDCQGKWVMLDTDSQGGRGYCCDQCQSYVWISWGVDR